MRYRSYPGTDLSVSEVGFGVWTLAAGWWGDFTDEQAISVLQSEAKKRAEAAEVYAQAGRAESAAKERAELAVIERYLPAAMSDEELGALVDAAIAQAAAGGAEGPKAMGQVIKAVREQAGASADGGRIAAAVKARLG